MCEPPSLPALPRSGLGPAMTLGCPDSPCGIHCQGLQPDARALQEIGLSVAVHVGEAEAMHLSRAAEWKLVGARHRVESPRLGRVGPVGLVVPLALIAAPAGAEDLRLA